MVLLEKPPRPTYWQFRTRGAVRQTSILDFARRAPSSTAPSLQIVPDNEHDWVPPVDLTLCRKGFLVRTDVIENREIVRRSIRDLTYNYPESNFEKQRRKQAQNRWGKTIKQAETAPLEVFCSYKHQSPTEMFAEGRAQEIGEKADWIEAMEEGSNANGNKAQRAKHANYVLLPKFFLLEQLKNRGPINMINENLVGEPMAETLQFNPNRKLVETKRRPQISATDFALHHLRTSGGAVVVLPVGGGKTVCALYIAMQLRVCTLVVAGNSELMDQWEERIKEYIPGARIGRIQESTCTIDDCDFVIGCTNSLAQRAYSKEKLRKIGMVIFDEAHHAAAPTFLTAVWQVAAPYMLALSQDPSRKDGMTHVLYHFFSYNVFIVPPSLPDDIKLYTIHHRFKRRCFIQDADTLSSAKLRDRRHNASQDSELLKYCEALASFDKKHYAAASMSAAALVLRAQTEPQADMPLPGLANHHAFSAWQTSYASDDIENLTYTQAYQSLQSDAHRNAVMVAYAKQMLMQNNAAEIRKPTVEEINDLSSASVFDVSRFHVNVRINAIQSSDNASTSGSTLKEAHLCTRDELQSMKQVERQILILASEKEHIDSLHDRMVRSGIPAAMIGVYVGGENKRLSRDEKIELLARRIILGTYAMAAEGLDVATLNVVAFITPRSSITDQAIGRALRDKLNPEIMPVVIDFVDDWSQMATNMHYTRCKSYQFYNAISKNFDDYGSFDAIGAVCWKKPLRNRTQRLADDRKEARERLKLERQQAKQNKRKRTEIDDGDEDEENKRKRTDDDGDEQVAKQNKRKRTEDEDCDDDDETVEEESDEISQEEMTEDI